MPDLHDGRFGSGRAAGRVAVLVLIPPLMLILILAGTVAARAWGQPPLPDDPDDLTAFQARQAFQDNCLICHSVEMVSSQRLTSAQWKSEVEKMVGWGAPVPPDQIEPLTAWLSQTYPPERPAEPPRRAPLALLGSAERPEPNAPTRPLATAPTLERGGQLYAAHCATCHGPDGSGGDLGPSLAARPVLQQPDAWARVLRDGRHRMPGFRLVLNEADEQAILDWTRLR